MTRRYGSDVVLTLTSRHDGSSYLMPLVAALLGRNAGMTGLRPYLQNKTPAVRPGLVRGLAQGWCPEDSIRGPNNLRPIYVDFKSMPSTVAGSAKPEMPRAISYRAPDWSETDLRDNRAI